MSFQSTIYQNMAFGVVGELFLSGPLRAQPGILNSADAADNVIGRAFTLESEGQAQAGGTGAFYGILVNPKNYAALGTQAGGPLAPTMTLPNGINAEFLQMGEIIVALPAACNIGDRVLFDDDGDLSTEPPALSFTAAIAAAVDPALSVMTVSAMGANSAPIRPGAQIRGANVTPGTVVVAQLTGTTGGAGTYSVSVDQVAASAAVTGENVIPPTGKLYVPNAQVTRYNLGAAGLGVIKLTN